VENFISALKATPAHFTPNGDGSEDTTLISAALASPDIWVMSVRNAAGSEVQAFSGTGTGAAVAQVWDGKSAAGALVPDGEYKVRLTVPGVAEAPEIPVSVESVDKPPIVQITAPKNREDLRGIVDVRGTVLDSSLQSWTLEYRMQDEASWTQIATGSGTAKDKVLGKFDTTTLMNDFYELRLRAVDGLGQSSLTVTRVNVVGELKIGPFIVSFTDLAIPLMGIPIVISRTYDSFQRNVKGDFGYGWRMDLQDGRIRENINHDVFITLPDGKRSVFKFSPLQADPRFNPNLYIPRFIPDAQVYDHLDYVGDHQLWRRGDEYLHFNEQGELSLFDPDVYVLTRRDGMEFTYRQDEGLKSIRDMNGNKITYSAGAILHSSGSQITIGRDIEGRVAYLEDIDGNRVVYGYDINRNDLLSVTDQSGGVTLLGYVNHYLSSIDEPVGKRGMRNEYDSAGRLVRHTTATGAVIEYKHDLSLKQETIFDLRGNPTIYEYDERGRIAAITSALGDRREYEFDERGNVTRLRDEGGRVMFRTYDNHGNILTDTDAKGNITRFSYSANQRLESRTDALGNVFRYNYDSKGNMIAAINSLGITEQQRLYDEKGQVVELRDAIGQITSFAYDAYGNLVTLVDPLGNAQRFSYDRRGNLLDETDALGNVEAFEYNAANLIVRSVDPLNQATSYLYNDSQQVVSVVESTGSETSYDYNSYGMPVRVLYADGSSVLMEYDSGGNMIRHIDRRENETRYVYDALNRCVRIVRADGSTVEYVYDAIGRIISTSDKISRSTFTYDAGSNVTAMTNAMQESVSFDYDAVGRRTAVISPSGQRTNFGYDASGRLFKVTFEDGTTEYSEYDVMGRVVSMKDRAGNVRSYVYDALGRVVSSVDPVGESWSFKYDSVGNVVSVMDPMDYETKYEYDALARRIKTIFADGLEETSHYTAPLSSAKFVSANGDMIDYLYDSLGRVEAKIGSDGHAVRVEYNENGQRTKMEDESGVTLYSYDKGGRLHRIEQLGVGAVEYEYDSAGNLVLLRSPRDMISYEYDSVNRLVATASLLMGRCSYSRNIDGLVSSVTYPNGIVEEYDYDRVNRVLSSRIKSATGLLHEFHYSYDDNGNRMEVVEDGKTKTEWKYDGLDRIVSEVRSELGGTVLYASGYGYDPVGNVKRVIKGTEVTDFSYDNRHRLVAAGGRVFEWDNAGNLVLSREVDGSQISYEWDVNNRLRQIIASNEHGQQSVSYTYNGDGLRVRKDVSAVSASRVSLLDVNRLNSEVLQDSDLDGSRTLSRWHGERLIGQSDINEERFYHYDALGNARLLTDNDGVITDEFWYSAFGEPSSTGVLGDEAGRYAGEGMDAETGHYYLRARYMDPSVGRFISRDPFSGGITDTTSLNPYMYARANPVRFSDPSGYYTPADGDFVELVHAGFYLAQHFGDDILDLARGEFTSIHPAVAATIAYVLGSASANFLGIDISRFTAGIVTGVPGLFIKLFAGSGAAMDKEVYFNHPLSQDKVAPDILNFVTMTWLEVKPLTKNEYFKAKKARSKYRAYLPAFTPDEDYIPIPPIIPGPGMDPFYLFQVGAVVFYTNKEVQYRKGRELRGRRLESVLKELINNPAIYPYEDRTRGYGGPTWGEQLLANPSIYVNNLAVAALGSIIIFVGIKTSFRSPI
jgi:RHS repeat-associated protein